MANELELKYGCNPNQKPARIFMKDGELPIEVLNGLTCCIFQLKNEKNSDLRYS